MIETSSQMAETTSGANSLHTRSMRRIIAFNLVSVYAFCRSAVMGSAMAGTQSRSMAIVFATPLKRSRMPKKTMRLKMA